MNISRELALEILNLPKDYSKSDLNKEFNRLTKTCTSDANLFRLITTCKEVLLDTKTNEENINSEKNSSPNAAFDEFLNSNNREHDNTRKKNITLPTLYDIIDSYQELSRYEEKYDIQKILCSPVISFYKRNHHADSLTVFLDTTYLSYKTRGFIYFYQEIDIPESLKTSRSIEIVIDFMNTWYRYNISKKKNSINFSYTMKDSLYKKFPKTVVHLKFNF